MSFYKEFIEREFPVVFLKKWKNMGLQSKGNKAIVS